MATALAVAVIWAGITGVRGFVPDLREAAASLRTGAPPPKYNPRPLAGVVAPGDTLLAEDPGIAVLLGRTPIILDAFMLRRLDEAQPRMVDVLVARIEGGEFDLCRAHQSFGRGGILVAGLPLRPATRDSAAQELRLCWYMPMATISTSQDVRESHLART